MNQYTRKYTENDYIDRCNELDVEYIGSVKDDDGSTLIKYVCKKHRDKGVQSTDWGHFKIQKNSCKYCSGRHRTTEEAQQMVRNKNIEFISEYHGAEKPIKCLCHKCGNVWITNRPIDLFRREVGCSVCSLEQKSKKRRKTTEEFINDLSLVNPNIEITGDYTGSHKLIKCRCKVDGYEWSSYPANLLNGSAGCPICNTSHGERAIVQFMEELNINYQRQKTFSGCEDVGLLRFDVFDEDNNIAIEFQGEQHYFPIDFSGNGQESAIIEFNNLQRRDRIKREFCRQNDITLIEIPYWERGNEREFLINNENYKERYIA